MSTGLKNLFFDQSLLEHGNAEARFLKVRNESERLSAPLTEKDCAVQSMLEASPVKWNLAHTSWFFETFLLKKFLPDYQLFDDEFPYFFNSYYEAEGARQPRGKRGILTRPDLARVMKYRTQVTEAIAQLIGQSQKTENWQQIATLIDIGCHHEEQHQELLLTDIKHVFFSDPLKPVYFQPEPRERRDAPDLGWVFFEAGVTEIGHSGEGFGFDCEGPRHRIFLESFSLANRLATNGEYLEFIQDGGYSRTEFWLTDGFDWVLRENLDHPIYWQKDADGWQQFTLHGMASLDPSEPVSHLSYYEANAFAKWSGCRLPYEGELEQAVGSIKLDGTVNDLASGLLMPRVAVTADGIKQLAGEVWEWTLSAFAPYPGFQAEDGALGEYNGKFMCNQFVLRGGSCLTPAGHWRPTYRNFFYPDARWQMTGIRLARTEK